MTEPMQRGGARISEHVLSSGMRVLIAERRGDPVVATLLFYRVGARNEREHEAGVSHFLEHLMFKGTQKLAKGEIDRITAELGGVNNAFTGNDHTAYWFELASDRWEAALDIELERMRALRLDAAEFEAEREVVLEELSMGEDEPWRVLTRRAEALLFPRHPYGRPVIGYRETLRALKVEDVRAYYERFYHPSNALLVVCGDVGSEAALAAVERRFGALEAGPDYAAVDAPRFPDEPLAGEVRFAMRWDDPGSRLCIAWRGVRVGTREDDGLDLLCTALGAGRMSRLQRRLVFDERLATSISVSNDSRIEGGVFWILAEAAQGVEPAKLERALDEELGRCASELLSAAELERARALLRSSEAFEIESVSDLGEELGAAAIDADWRNALDGGVRRAQISASEVRELARQLLRPDQRVLGWSLPKAAARADEARPKKASATTRKARAGKARAR